MMMLKSVLATALALPLLVTVASAEGCNYPKVTMQTPAPVASAPQSAVPAEPVKIDIAQAPTVNQPTAPKTN